ncbi:3-deoxy-manno-octulosonate cytidylyltransferase [bacterium]|nr:3-deoxy-manno-octulosonate cytidylyltransferase [bacterium]
MRIIGVIPARWGSTRLPGKPLADLNGKTLIERVWRQASKAKKLSRLMVATDDQRIFDTVLSFGGEVIMTSPQCATGTDRLAEVAARVTGDLIVNIQGDEPFLPPAYIDKLVAPFQKDKQLKMSTLAAPLPDREVRNSNSVKVVCTLDGHALYFSRSPIPYIRSTHHKSFLLHLGIYAYRRAFLLEFAKWKQTPLEKSEQLEQLRALEMGVAIKVCPVSRPLLSIDTPADLQQAKRMIKARK